jgi:hypothetical protein
MIFLLNAERANHPLQRGLFDQARKVAMRAKLNTLSSNDVNLDEKCIKIDLRRADSTGIDLSLEFYSRIKTKG